MKFESELLLFADGIPVTDAVQWPARRNELLKILRREVYGNSSAAPEKVNGQSSF